MNIKELMILTKEKSGMIVLLGIFSASIFFWGAIIVNKNFKARSDVLIVQNQNGYSDYYALSRSADYLSKVLTEAMYSERFIERIKEKNIVNVEELLPGNKQEKLEKWSKIIRVEKKSDTGIITVEIFGATPTIAVQTSEAVLKVLTEDYYIFLGRGQDLDVRILSGPILEKTFGIFSLVFIILGGFIIGSFLTIIWIYFKKELESNVVTENILQ